MKAAGLAIILGCSGGAAGSQGLAVPQVNDLDGDGVYSFAELLAALPALTVYDFMLMDLDKDGSVDPRELDAATMAGQLPTL